jgi:hypothetical protein
MITIHHLLSTLSSPEDLQNPPRPLPVKPELTAKASRLKVRNVINGAPLIPIPHLCCQRDHYHHNLR